jgi:hypothetical protein
MTLCSLFQTVNVSQGQQNTREILECAWCCEEMSSAACDTLYTFRWVRRLFKSRCENHQKICPQCKQVVDIAYARSWSDARMVTRSEPEK